MLSIEKHSLTSTLVMWLIAQSSQTLGVSRAKILHQAPLATHFPPSSVSPPPLVRVDRRSCGLCGLLNGLLPFVMASRMPNENRKKKTFQAVFLLLSAPSLPTQQLFSDSPSHSLSVFLYYLMFLLHFFRSCLSPWYFVCHLEKWMPLHALLKGT